MFIFTMRELHGSYVQKKTILLAQLTLGTIFKWNFELIIKIAKLVLQAQLVIDTIMH